MKSTENRTYPVKAIATLVGFLACEIAKTIVLGFGVTALVVVEGWEKC